MNKRHIGVHGSYFCISVVYKACGTWMAIFSIPTLWLLCNFKSAEPDYITRARTILHVWMVPLYGEVVLVAGDIVSFLRIQVHMAVVHETSVVGSVD